MFLFATDFPKVILRYYIFILYLKSFISTVFLLFSLNYLLYSFYKWSYFLFYLFRMFVPFYAMCKALLIA